MCQKLKFTKNENESIERWLASDGMFELSDAEIGVSRHV